MASGKCTSRTVLVVTRSFDEEWRVYVEKSLEARDCKVEWVDPSQFRECLNSGHHKISFLIDGVNLVAGKLVRDIVKILHRVKPEPLGSDIYQARPETLSVILVPDGDPDNLHEFEDCKEWIHYSRELMDGAFDHLAGFNLGEPVHT